MRIEGPDQSMRIEGPDQSVHPAVCSEQLIYSTIPLLRPLLGLSKSGLISGMVLILNTGYSKCPEISRLYFFIPFLPNFCFYAVVFLKYLEEWQTM